MTERARPASPLSHFPAGERLPGAFPPALLIAVGEALYTPARWKRDLGADVFDRGVHTLMRWAAGDGPIPPDAPFALARALAEKRARLAALSRALLDPLTPETIEAVGAALYLPDRWKRDLGKALALPDPLRRLQHWRFGRAALPDDLAPRLRALVRDKDTALARLEDDLSPWLS